MSGSLSSEIIRLLRPLRRSILAGICGRRRKSRQGAASGAPKENDAIMMEKSRRISLLAMLAVGAAMGQADRPPAAVVAGIPVNYDEAKVGTYTLPDPLLLAGGKPVRDAKTWNEKRRGEIVRLFEENQYGRAPLRPAAMSFDVFDKGTPALDGKTITRQATIYFSADKAGPKMDLLVYVPANAAAPVPLLLNIGFSANSSTVNDPGVKEI